MFMLILVLNDPNQTEAVLDTWDEAGAPGVTILTSTGLGRVRDRRGLQDDVPLMPSLEDFFQNDENLNRTLVTFVTERDMVDKIVQATQALLGDLNKPHTGILAVIPALEIYGLNRLAE